MEGISVVINTYNAEKHLKRVLESVKEFSEIIICDMYSTDATLLIANSFGARVVYHEKMGYVEPARNFAIQQATHDWILLLDADEIPPAALKERLVDIAKENQAECVAFPRKNYFLGKWMRSAYPDYVYRFFKKNAVVWPEEIHSVPKISGKVLKIPAKDRHLALEHLADDSISVTLHKNNIYSDAEIPKRKGKPVTAFKLMFSPLSWFFKYYILKKGFLDGKEGFIFAQLKSQYKFATLAKVYEDDKHLTNK